MKSHLKQNHGSGVEQDPFSFFPENRKGSSGDGREPHEHLKQNPIPKQFPSERQIGVILFVSALLLYLFSMSWRPFPGLPTQALMTHLKLELAPSTLDSLWGWGIRVFAHLPWLSVSAWAGLSSAVCGAASVSLLGRLMTRVGYLIRNEPGPISFIREAQARRISGVVAGLFLMCSSPFWFLSTRSMPGTFHVLLLLLTAWAFSQYQHWGKWRHLALVGFLYGVGITEFATFILFIPLMILLLIRELIRWKVLSSWKVHLIFWGPLLLGLSLYLFNAGVLYRQGAYVGRFSSPGQAWFAILHEQLNLILLPRASSGFPAIMFFSLMPWLTLFAMSRRSPWFYEWGQVIVRFIFVGGLLGILFNAAFSPWNLLGLSYVMVTPYLLFAVCTGYMAGEFWILGERKVMGDPTWFTNMGHRLAGVLALILPVVIVGSGIYNFRGVDGRAGKAVEAAAQEVLDNLDGRDVLFSLGLLDRPIRLLVWEQRLPVRVISAPRTASPVYLKRLAPLFSSEPLRQALWNGEFGVFLETLLLEEDGPGRVGIIDMPEVFREFGYLVPDGLLYRLEPSAAQVDLEALIEMQRPFWAQMEEVAGQLASKENVARRYQDLLLELTSKVANNLGVMQAEQGDEEGALETFRQARRFFPENISVLLNLLELGRERDLPEASELEAEWETLQTNMGNNRWVLAIRYGYVWRAREWVRRGWVWVLSGAPAKEEASRRKSTPDSGVDPTLKLLLAQAYQEWGTASRDENDYRSMLIRNPRNSTALLSLCRFALRKNDLEAAEAYMREAMVMGMPEEATLFDRAMIHVVRKEHLQAVEMLVELSRQTPGDVRIFLALLLLTETDDPLHSMALKVLRTHRGMELSGRLVLARAFLDAQNWAEAQGELEQALQLDSQNTQAWEMMVHLAQESGNQALAKSSLRALLDRNPNHYLQYQEEGLKAYRVGNLALAEEMFRAGVERHSDATLMNNLAHVMMERGGNLEEALAWVNKALTVNPGQSDFLNTRGAIYQELGRYEEARVDLQASLKKQGPKKHVLLMLAESYAELGDRARALKIATALAQKPDELSADEKRQVRELILRVR
jgi:Tfp pilus assembly protein PilF